MARSPSGEYDTKVCGVGYQLLGIMQVCCTRLIRTLITVCSASFHLLLIEFDIPELRQQLIHLFEVSRRTTLHFARSFLPPQLRMWNDLPYSVFDTETRDGFKGAVNVGCFPELCFLQFSVAHVLVELRKKFTNNFVFPAWAYAAGFNNNNNQLRIAVGQSQLRTIASMTVDQIQSI